MGLAWAVWSGRGTGRNGAVWRRGSLEGVGGRGAGSRSCRQFHVGIHDANSSPLVRVVTPASPSVGVAGGGSGSAAVSGSDVEAVRLDFLYSPQGSLHHRSP